jgi:hypothetical protein
MFKSPKFVTSLKKGIFLSTNSNAIFEYSLKNSILLPPRIPAFEEIIGPRALTEREAGKMKLCSISANIL